MNATQSISLISLCIASSAALPAADITWDGSANNNWRNNSNWSGGGTPQSTDTAILPSNESDNDIDLSDSSNDDVDRYVNAAEFHTDGTNSTSNSAYGGGSFNWGIRKGTINSNNLYWNSSATGHVLTAHVPLRATSANPITLRGNTGTTSQVHTFEQYGDTFGIGNIETASGFNDIFSIHVGTSFTGTWKISSGTLKIRHDLALQNARVNLSGTGTLDITGQSPTIDALQGNGGITISNSQTLTINGDVRSSDYSGSFSGSGTLIKQGTLNCTLKGNSSLSGETIINGGILILSNSGALPNSAIDLSTNGTLQTSTGTSIGNLKGSGTLQIDGNLSVRGASLVSPTFTGTINGSNSLTFSNGTHTVTGTSGNYSGNLILTGGTLYTSATRFEDSLVTISSDDALDLTTNTTFGNLSGTGDLNLDYDLTFGGDDNDATYSGDLSGTSSLTKQGTGTWSYNGSHSGNGSTDINGGALGGTGSFSSGVYIASTAAISPGNSAGTLTVDGIEIDGTYLYEIDGSSADNLAVTGDLDLGASSVLDIDVLGGGVTETAYIVASYGTLNGTFGSISDMPSQFYIDYAYNDGSSSNNIALVKDTTTPTLTGITLDVSLSDPTNANTIIFDIQFSEAVTGVNAADFTVSYAGGAMGTATLSGSGDSRTLTIPSVDGDGIMTISLPDGSGIVDHVGNGIQASSLTNTVEIDNTKPKVASFTLQVGQDNPTNADTVYVEVSFTEPVTGVNEFDIGVSASGASYISKSISGSGQDYVLQINGVDGDGFLRAFDNASSSNIDDLAGNRESGGITQGLRIDIDNTAPSVDSITPITSSPTNSGSVAFTVVFDEAPTNFDALDDLNITTSGVSYTGGSISGSDLTYTANITGITGDGTIAIQVNAGIEDSLGNASGSASITSAAITIDQTIPTVDSITTTTSSPSNSTTVSYSVAFSEVVDFFDDAADLDITKDAALSYSGLTVSDDGDGENYTVEFTGLTGDGNLSISVKTDNGVQDLSGNALASSISSTALEFDNTAPTVSFATTATSPSDSSSISYTVTFSEPVKNFNAANDLTISKTGGLAHSGITVSDLGNRDVYTVSVNNLSGDGTFTLTVKTTKNIKDDANNLLVSSPTTAAFQIDQNAPEVVSITPSSVGPIRPENLSFDIVFSEPVTGVDSVSDFVFNTVSGGTFNPATVNVSGTGTDYTVDFPDADTEGSFTLELATSTPDIVDTTGKALASTTTSAAVAFDGVHPTVLSITPSETIIKDGNVTFDIVFDETVLNFNNSADLYVTQTGDVNWSFNNITGALDTYIADLHIGSGSGDMDVEVYELSDITDSVGNPYLLHFPRVTGTVTIDADAVTADSVRTKLRSDRINGNSLPIFIGFDSDVVNFNAFDDLAITTLSGNATSTGATFHGTIGTGDEFRYYITLTGITGTGTFEVSVDLNSDVESSTGGDLIASDASDPIIIDTTTPIHYVSATGSNEAPYDTWAKAAHNLQDAIDASAVNDAIWIAEGTYHPDQGASVTIGNIYTDFEFLEGQSIRGGFPVDGGDGTLAAQNIALYETVLSGDLGTPNDFSDNSSTVVGIDPDFDTQLDGLVIEGASETGLSVSAGLGILTISNCHFRNNETTENGGALHMEGNDEPSIVQIKNSAFYGNHSDNDGGAIYLVDGATLLLENCTLAGNNADGSEGGAIAWDDSSATPTLTLLNTLVWNNQAAGSTSSASASLDNTSSATLTYAQALVENWDLSASGGLDGTNAALDPLFLSEPDPTVAPSALGDLRLPNATPVLDLGAPETIPQTYDLGRYPRISGAAIDLGAYESGNLAPRAIEIVPQVLNTRADSVAFDITFDLAVQNFDALADLDIVLDAGMAVGGASFSGTGSTYTVTLTGISGFGEIALRVSTSSDITDTTNSLSLSNSVTSASIAINEKVIYHVSPNGSATAPYDTWPTAANHLQDALALAISEDQIWIAEGTYKPDQGNAQTPDDKTVSFTIPSGVSLYGGFPVDGGDGSFAARDYANYTTILSGDLGIAYDPDSVTPETAIADNAYHVLRMNSTTEDILVDGVAITLGAAADFSGTGPADANTGGGALITACTAAVTFANVVFEQNFGFTGSAIHASNADSLVLKNTVLSGNQAGAATINCTESSLYLENTTLSGNTADNVTAGVAIATTGNATHTFSTRNSIIWDNDNKASPNTAAESLSITGTFTEIKANSIAEHIDWSLLGLIFDGTNSANDPQFYQASTAAFEAGDLRLKVISPFIDQGGSENYPEALDLAGNPRIAGADIDLGAYDRSTTNATPSITLIGDAAIEIILNGVWIDPSATASDPEDGELTVITSGSTVNTTVEGVYTIHYDATDGDGASATTVSRTVTVKTDSAYELWAIAKGLTEGVDDGYEEDPDKDNRTNIEEFTFDGDPGNGSNDGKMRIGFVSLLDEENATQQHLSITFPVPTGSTFGDFYNGITGNAKSGTVLDDGSITYRLIIEGSYDLNSRQAQIDEVSPAESSGMPSLSTGWEYKTFHLRESVLIRPKGFIHMRLDEVAP